MEHALLTTTAGIFVAAASGIIGSFLVLRKMTLISDALSHVALPGIALGILFSFEPLLGGLGFLFVAALLIWKIEEKTKLAIESVTGVLFVSALAIGTLLIEEHELLEAFFGSVESVTFAEALLQIGLSLIILGIMAKFWKPLLLTSIAPDLSAAEKISRSRMELLLLILIALTITIGISFVGVLLMSALLIIPAATARNIAHNLTAFVVLSVTFAIISLGSGIGIATITEINPGIITALVSAGLFVISLPFTKKS